MKTIIYWVLLTVKGKKALIQMLFTTEPSYTAGVSIILALCTLLVSYHFCETEGAIEQEALSSTSQQDLMSDHGAAQHLSVKHHRQNELPYRAKPALTQSV